MLSFPGSACDPPLPCKGACPVRLRSSCQIAEALMCSARPVLAGARHAAGGRRGCGPQRRLAHSNSRWAVLSHILHTVVRSNPAAQYLPICSSHPQISACSARLQPQGRLPLRGSMRTRAAPAAARRRACGASWMSRRRAGARCGRHALGLPVAVGLFKRPSRACASQSPTTNVRKA